MSSVVIAAVSCGCGVIIGAIAALIGRKRRYGKERQTVDDRGYRGLTVSYGAELEYQIAQQNDLRHATFIVKNCVNGSVKGSDLDEIRGYYKGLKVARSILLKAADMRGLYEDLTAAIEREREESQ